MLVTSIALIRFHTSFGDRDTISGGVEGANWQILFRNIRSNPIIFKLCMVTNSCRLKLNSDKTVAGSRKGASVSQGSYLSAGKAMLKKKLGVYTDASLAVMKHIDYISRSAYLEIRRNSSVRIS